MTTTVKEDTHWLPRMANNNTCTLCYYLFALYLITMELADLPETQWVAVKIHWGWIREPPQYGNPYVVLSWACHGQSPCLAAVPPTILVCGRVPQAPTNGIVDWFHAYISFTYIFRSLVINSWKDDKSLKNEHMHTSTPAWHFEIIVLSGKKVYSQMCHIGKSNMVKFRIDCP
jgi:hypothetical protein